MGFREWWAATEPLGTMEVSFRRNLGMIFLTNTVRIPLPGVTQLQLHNLNITNSKVTTAGVKELQNTLPNLRIHQQ